RWPGLKLGIKPGHRLALVAAPAQVVSQLTSQLPPGVTPVRRLVRRGPPCDVIVCFSAERGALAARLPRLRDCLHHAGGLWLCWPKRTSDRATELTENAVRELGLSVGLVDNKVCAVDA